MLALLKPWLAWRVSPSSRACALGLIDPVRGAAVDATGREARHVSAHFGHRRSQGKKRSGHRQRAWPKLTTVLHTRSHLMLAAVPGPGPSQDSPDFTPAMRQAATKVAFDTVLGEAGYDAEHNHRLCHEELGVARTLIRLNRRNTGRRWPGTPDRRAMRHRFPKPIHHQRWHVESGFSQHKRRLGSALTARKPAAQSREILPRLLTNNLILRAIWRSLSRNRPATRTSARKPQWVRYQNKLTGPEPRCEKLTTTGFGDITLPGTGGRITTVIIMIAGVTLFLRLAQVLFRPSKARFRCPQCGLSRHDTDAVHCKACGVLPNIPDEGGD